MGTRALPAWRFLARHAKEQGMEFLYQPVNPDDRVQRFDSIVVMSPAMFLPAVIAKAEAIAKFNFGGTAMLGVKRSSNHLGVLGVEADVLPVDGSAAGLMRSFLLIRACEQLFDFGFSNSKKVDLSRIAEYYNGEGQAAVLGKCSDLLTEDVSHYEWSQS